MNKLYNYLNKGYHLIEERFVKSDNDIEGIVKSSVITKGALDLMDDFLKAGVTTNEINKKIHEFTLSKGGIPAPLDYHGFPKSVCTSINEVICHGIPSDRPLKNGDIVNVDVTTILDGYYSDSSRMYIIGEGSDGAKKLVQAAKKCLEIGIEAVKPYQPINRIGEHIEAYANGLGYSVVRDFVGHGIGLEFHEPPHVFHFKSSEKGEIMIPGMVFTIEPMINEGTFETIVLEDNWTAVTADGKLSAQWEHTVLVTADGCRILT